MREKERGRDWRGGGGGGGGGEGEDQKLSKYIVLFMKQYTDQDTVM